LALHLIPPRKHVVAVPLLDLSAPLLDISTILPRTPPSKGVQISHSMTGIASTHHRPVPNLQHRSMLVMISAVGVAKGDVISQKPLLNSAQAWFRLLRMSKTTLWLVSSFVECLVVCGWMMARLLFYCSSQSRIPSCIHPVLHTPLMSCWIFGLIMMVRRFWGAACLCLPTYSLVSWIDVRIAAPFWISCTLMSFGKGRSAFWHMDTATTQLSRKSGWEGMEKGDASETSQNLGNQNSFIIFSKMAIHTNLHLHFFSNMI